MWSRTERAAMAQHIRGMATVMGAHAPCGEWGCKGYFVERKVWQKGPRAYKVFTDVPVFKCTCGLGRVSWVFGKTKVTCNATKSAVLALAERIEKAKPLPAFNPSNFKV